MKRKMQGQASIEFMVLFPMFMLLVLLLITLALQWHAFHVTRQSALEGASLGTGIAMAEAGTEAAFADITVAKTGDAFAPEKIIEAPNSRWVGYSASGYAPQLISNPAKVDTGDPDTKGYVQAPGSWVFIPCDAGCR